MIPPLSERHVTSNNVEGTMQRQSDKNALRRFNLALQLFDDEVLTNTTNNSFRYRGHSGRSGYSRER